VADTRLTFLDFQRQLDPSGKNLLPVAEVLNQINAPLQDGPITPSNADLGHRVTFRSGLPTVSTGKVNKGVSRSKSATEQRTESMALFVGRSEVDVKQKVTWGESKFNMRRASEDISFAEAFSQYVALQFMYGTITTDEATFDGVATRMPSLQQPAPGSNGSQVWSMGAVTGGDGTSMYIVDWQADRGCHWIYPAESATGGLIADDKGEIPVNDVDSNPFFAAVTEYMWAIGLAVEDPRRIARIANIDVSDANLGASATQGQLSDKLIDVLSYMPSPDGFQRVIYCQARLWAAFRKQILGKTNALLTMEDYLKMPTPHFDGIPMRRCDQISISEGTVS
jgi:hypothetical protein